MKVLTFLNLLDAENNLSLTNLSLWLVLCKIPFSHSFADVAVILPAIALYAHKRVVVAASVKEQSVELKDVLNTISKMTEELNQVKALADEAVSTANKTTLGIKYGK